MPATCVPCPTVAVVVCTVAFVLGHRVVVGEVVARRRQATGELRVVEIHTGIEDGDYGATTPADAVGAR
jgi:hypothetical protein